MYIKSRLDPTAEKNKGGDHYYLVMVRTNDHNHQDNRNMSEWNWVFALFSLSRMLDPCSSTIGLQIPKYTRPVAIARETRKKKITREVEGER